MEPTGLPPLVVPFPRFHTSVSFYHLGSATPWTHRTDTSLQRTLLFGSQPVPVIPIVPIVPGPNRSPIEMEIAIVQRSNGCVRHKPIFWTLAKDRCSISSITKRKAKDGKHIMGIPRPFRSHFVFRKDAAKVWRDLNP